MDRGISFELSIFGSARVGKARCHVMYGGTWNGSLDHFRYDNRDNMKHRLFSTLAFLRWMGYQKLRALLPLSVKRDFHLGV